MNCRHNKSIYPATHCLTWLNSRLFILLGSTLYLPSIPLTGNPYRKGRLWTDDLLVPASLYQLLFILKILFTLVTKQSTLRSTSTVLSLLLKLVFPALAYLSSQPTPNFSSHHFFVSSPFSFS
jgi:hypothetical protein